MATFVLVHGAYMGGWSWHALKPRLEAQGHTVFAPDLLGYGADKTPARDVTLVGWAQQVADLVKAQPQKVVLVGHSRGGHVISQAGEYAAANIAVLVYATALFVPNGACATDVFQIMSEEGFAADSFGVTPVPSEDGASFLPPPDAATLFYGDADPALRAEAAKWFQPEPIAPMMTPLALSAEKWGRLPKIYIETTKDEIVPIAAQRAMIARGKPNEVISLPTGHDLIRTDVERVATILTDIARRYVS